MKFNDSNYRAELVKEEKGVQQEHLVLLVVMELRDRLEFRVLLDPEEKMDHLVFLDFMVLKDRREI